jgi:hypothetical protein
MQFVYSNIWAVIAMAVVYMGLAILWYSQSCFGRLWCSTKKETQCCKPSAKKKILSFVQALVMAFVFGCVLNAFSPATALEGIQIGLMLWLGFSAAHELSAVLWCGHSLKNYCIDTGFMLVTFAIWGAVFAVW